MVSIIDVADQAEVSITTVSRFFNDPDRVKPNTRARIQKAIEALGYAPNSLARNFRMGRTQIILVMTSGAGDAFYRQVLKGITNVATDRGYTVRIQEVVPDVPAPTGIAHILASRQADGVIVLGHAGVLGGKDANAMNVDGLPIVVCGESSDQELAGFPRFQIDGFAAARQLTHHVRRLGHSKIGFMSGAMPLLVLSEREAGYRAAMEEAALPIEPSWLCHANMTPSGARRAVADLLNEGNLPTALICATDEMALGAMAEFQARGLDVPRDMSIAGFDDIRYAALANPPLTTVAQPGVDIGERGADHLLRMIDGKKVNRGVEFLPHQLIERRSLREIY